MPLRNVHVSASESVALGHRGRGNALRLMFPSQCTLGCRNSILCVAVCQVSSCKGNNDGAVVRRRPHSRPTQLPVKLLHELVHACCVDSLLSDCSVIWRTETVARFGKVHVLVGSHPSDGRNRHKCICHVHSLQLVCLACGAASINQGQPSRS